MTKRRKKEMRRDKEMRKGMKRDLKRDKERRKRREEVGGGDEKQLVSHKTPVSWRFLLLFFFQSAAKRLSNSAEVSAGAHCKGEEESWISLSVSGIKGKSSDREKRGWRSVCRCPAAELQACWISLIRYVLLAVLFQLCCTRIPSADSTLSIP